MSKQHELNKPQLNALKKRYKQWLEKQEPKRLTAYPCPKCKEGITTLKPRKNERPFDTLATCPFCGSFHFKIVRSSGIVKVVKPDLARESLQ